MPSTAELVCVDPKRVHEFWPHVSPLLKAACYRTRLNAFADIETDILSGRSLLWMAWNGRTVESAVAAILINSEIGKVCIITVCGGSDMKRWLAADRPDRDLRKSRRLQARPDLRAQGLAACARRL